MKLSIQSLVCAILLGASVPVSTAQDERTEKIEFSQVPAAILNLANQIEKRADWTQSFLEKSENSSIRRYILKGRIVIRPQQEKVRSDGDIDIVPGEYETLEVGIWENGQLNYVVKSVPLHSVPKHVLAALRKTIDISPSDAFAVRFTAQGQPNGYIIRIDSGGILQYMVTADGKKVERI